MKTTQILKLLREEESRTLGILDAIIKVISIYEEMEGDEVANVLAKADNNGEGRDYYKKREDFRKWRKHSGIRQSDFAEQAGVSTGTLVRYEQGLPIRRKTEEKILNAIK